MNFPFISSVCKILFGYNQLITLICFSYAGSAPNLLRFIPPHLMMQSQQAGNKTLGHQGFPTENGMLRPLHQHRNNMGYRPGFQVNNVHFDHCIK